MEQTSTTIASSAVERVANEVPHDVQRTSMRCMFGCLLKELSFSADGARTRVARYFNALVDRDVPVLVPTAQAFRTLGRGVVEATVLL